MRVSGNGREFQCVKSLKNQQPWQAIDGAIHPAHMTKRILFLCSQNKLRSPTAEAVFAGHPSVEVDSAGLNNDAEVVLSEEQVEWADLILVMEAVHRSRLNRKFSKSLAGKRVVVLNIPDDYHYMDPSLIQLLKQRCAPYIP
jgi:predicted protein tyrosine phosphatase